MWPCKFTAAARKMDAAHKVARYDNEEYQAKLVVLAKEYAEDKNKSVARAAKFYLLENKLLTAEELKKEELPKALDEAFEFLKEESSDATRLSLHETCIDRDAVINLQPDNKRAQEDYKRFGNLFAKSDLREIVAIRQTHFQRNRRAPTGHRRQTNAYRRSHPYRQSIHDQRV